MVFALDSHGRLQAYSTALERSNLLERSNRAPETAWRSGEHARDDGAPTAVERRLAGAPISWGVCEVPGWGLQLPPERVLAEMASLGLHATELGPLGYLPLEPRGARALLDRHGLRLVGGFVRSSSTSPTRRRTRAQADAAAAKLAAAGADVFVAALVADPSGRRASELDDGGWQRARRHLARSPSSSPRTASAWRCTPTSARSSRPPPTSSACSPHTDVGWCFDTGHLLIGGTDPAAFVRDHADRIVHVHLKDVDAALAARVRAGELSLVAATQAGLFRPLGQGDAGIEEVVRLLDATGTSAGSCSSRTPPSPGRSPRWESGPALDVRESIEFLRHWLRGERGCPTMKRLLAQLLLAVLALARVVVAGCGGGNNDDSSSSSGVDEHGQRRPDAGQRPDLRDGDP